MQGFRFLVNHILFRDLVNHILDRVSGFSFYYEGSQGLSYGWGLGSRNKLFVFGLIKQINICLVLIKNKQTSLSFN